MNKLSTVFIVTLLSIGSSVSLASNNMRTGSYLYMDFQVGYSNIVGHDLSVKHPTTNSTADLTTGGVDGRIATGYLVNNDDMAYGVELAYSHIGRTSYNVVMNNSQEVRNTGTLSVSSVDLLAVGKYFFAPQWNVIGKVGESYVTQVVDGSINTVPFNNNPAAVEILPTKTGFAPVIGLGIGYQYSQAVEYSLSGRYNFGSSFSSGRDIKLQDTIAFYTINAGLTYSF